MLFLALMVLLNLQGFFLIKTAALLILSVLTAPFRPRACLMEKSFSLVTAPAALVLPRWLTHLEFENEQSFPGADVVDSRPSEENATVNTEYAKEPSPVVMAQNSHSEPQPGSIEYSVTDKDISGEASTIDANKSLEDIAADMGPIVSALGATDAEKDYSPFYQSCS